MNVWTVDSKVIFGQFHSDLFEVANGVKQGCILSPSIFNIIMSDLEDLLRSTQGVQTGNIQIKGLFYADDIVLFAETEDGLQSMLNIADKFANKWGLKFNEKKSKIMVIGKRRSEKEWPLGGNLLKETDTYKYLGVIINRNLTDTNHIKGHLDNKASKGAAYTRFTLTRHSDINRIDFGNTLWNNAVLPSLSHACGIWFTNTKISRSILHSAQYKCAKAVLKLHSKPSAVATIAELGWLPIDAELDIQRINYFQHLKKMENTRITKMVFNELQELHFSHIDTPFKYFKNMKVIFEKYGLDQLFNRDAFPVKETKYFVYEKCALERNDYIPKKHL